MAWPKLFCFAVLSSLFIACTSDADPASSPKVHFEKSKIKIGDKTIAVELAKTSEQQQHGLMYRTKLADNEGMLFIFADEDFRAFWMKNTRIDLSIGYFDKARVLKEIIDMKATSIMETNPPTYPSRVRSQYALEMTKGWFAKNKIKVGDKFNWD